MSAAVERYCCHPPQLHVNSAAVVGSLTAEQLADQIHLQLACVEQSRCGLSKPMSLQLLVKLILIPATVFFLVKCLLI